MKRRMVWILLAGILVGITLSELYKHFVTDRIMDGGKVVWTELEVEERELVTPDGASLGRIKEFGYEASDGEGSGTLELTLERPDESEETVTFQKTQEQEQ